MLRSSSSHVGQGLRRQLSVEPSGEFTTGGFAAIAPKLASRRRPHRQSIRRRQSAPGGGVGSTSSSAVAVGYAISVRLLT